MLGRAWPRFALLALFLLAVAVVVGTLGLDIPQIVAVMLVAYLLTVVVEWAASRPRRQAAAPPVASETPPP
ncbi:MAG TPA: hypothetical protein VNT23_08425, partial [Gaiellaceae bacterium]|nr:hypothetical protein [Gaiellaceae bacterium]